ncbi:hypothetical protein BDK51DRAFT_41886 [Blyttiomyces helicus]|uniref:Uncharacterized protein n=1 Tax=Blyttiomyces helicus TaxID=388810 RepID=A0A4P9WCT2_9FUNG|nr:hypothetical protein BDK51DRAFT_41886 [Blyttiomyces helicus]|eukprot:RKO89475.1 hypothetical protein BDK51DRAFT_41886 [Blyttiomyces helicus]
MLTEDSFWRAGLCANEFGDITPGFLQRLGVLDGPIERREMQSARREWDLASGQAALGGMAVKMDMLIFCPAFDQSRRLSAADSHPEFSTSPHISSAPVFRHSSKRPEGPSVGWITSPLPSTTLASPALPRCSTPSRHVEKEQSACATCATPIATLILHGTPETIAAPHTMTLACLACDRGPTFNSGLAQTGGRKRLRAVGPTAPVECDLCGRILGFGGMRLETGADLAARDDWLEPGFDTEFVCLPCGAKYQHCAACGNGEKFRKGRWRPVELFVDAKGGRRRTCTLSHEILDDAELQNDLWRTTHDLSPEILNSLENFHREARTAFLASPKTMETIPEVKDLPSIIAAIERKWAITRDYLEADLAPPAKSNPAITKEALFRMLPLLGTRRRGCFCKLMEQRRTGLCLSISAQPEATGTSLIMSGSETLKLGEGCTAEQLGTQVTLRHLGLRPIAEYMADHPGLREEMFDMALAIGRKNDYAGHDVQRRCGQSDGGRGSCQYAADARIFAGGCYVALSRAGPRKIMGTERRFDGGEPLLDKDDLLFRCRPRSPKCAPRTATRNELPFAYFLLTSPGWWMTPSDNIFQSGIAGRRPPT